MKKIPKADANPKNEATRKQHNLTLPTHTHIHTQTHTRTDKTHALINNKLKIKFKKKHKQTKQFKMPTTTQRQEMLT